MNIVAIIVTYNAMQKDWIDLCLKSLKASTVPVTPIVIDNGSTDGTRDFVPKHYPEAIWLPQDKNLGFGQANNVGLKYALANQVDYVLLLNQDARLQPDAMEKMLAVIDDKSIVSPLQLNGDGTQLDFNFKTCLLTIRSEIIDDVLIKKQFDHQYVGGSYPAACWLMPINIIKKIGGFNPIFFHYGEDNNYLQRLEYHHLRVLLAPAAQMFHDRKMQGNIQMFKKNQYRREMLNIISNINLSLPRILVECLKMLLRSYTYGIAKREYIPGTFIRVMCWGIGHARAILRSRSQEKQIATSWL